jgi:hypothetical protein
MRLRVVVPIAAAGSVLAAALVLQQSVGAAAGRRPASTAGCDRRAPQSAAGFQRMFDGLDGTWAGGDQAATVALPGARTLWLFGDTVTGYRDAAGGYAPGWALRHNSLLLQDGGCVRTVETDLPETRDAWYWPAAGVVDAGRLEIFAMRAVRSSAAFGFRITGMALAEYDLVADGTPVLRSLHPLPSAPSTATDVTLWGQGVLDYGSEVYVYGTRGDTPHRALGRALFVARVPAGSVADSAAWRYFDGSRFVSDAAHAQPVVGAVGGVSTSVSLAATAHGVAVVSKQDEVFGSTVAAWTAPSPVGPFAEMPLFAAPSDPPRGVLRYSALAHPELRLADGSLLVTVCRNNTDLAAVGRDALLYRPQFTSVRLP